MTNRPEWQPPAGWDAAADAEGNGYTEELWGRAIKEFKKLGYHTVDVFRKAERKRRYWAGTKQENGENLHVGVGFWDYDEQMVTVFANQALSGQDESVITDLKDDVREMDESARRRAALVAAGKVRPLKHATSFQ